MTETTSPEDQPTTEDDRIAQILEQAKSPDAIARASVLALLLIADRLDDIRIEIGELATSM